MASLANESDEYLPSSDDSNDEDERPNRWTGPPGTWEQLNSAEINTLTALSEIRHQDLSVHLYNAFALKHRHDKGFNQAARPVPNEDINIATGQLVKEDKWVPPRSWTAWPLPANAVPHSQFMGRVHDADEAFTFKMQKPYMPKAELEEAISSTILRLAKEKFWARQAAQRNEHAVELGSQRSDEEDSETSVGSASGSAKLKRRQAATAKTHPVKYESTSEGELMDIEESNTIERPSSAPPEAIRLKTVVAADDELSYTLLRPSVQNIMGKLDATLMVLHKAQESRVTGTTDSDPDSSDTSRSHSRLRSRSRGRARDVPRSRDRKRRRTSESRASSGAEPPQESIEGRRKVGRPRKFYPRLNGETDKAFAIRIARLKKKAIPFFPEDDVEPASDSTPAPNVTSAGETSEKPIRESRRTRLRDWRDVLGAAALAGFPAPAIDRVARRCADLFGQSFTLYTLQESPQAQNGMGSHADHTSRTRVAGLQEGPEDGDDGGGWKPSQDLPSHTPGAIDTATYESEARGRGRSTSIYRRSRSRSHSVLTGGAHFCIIRDCPRAIDPFRRRTNMIRHLRLVHNYDSNELPVEVDSEDEMHGAVHVDGFLKPIKARRGWRDGDTATVRSRSRRRARRGRVKTEEIEDHEMQDADPTSSGDDSA